MRLIRFWCKHIFFSSQWAFCCFSLVWISTASFQSTLPWPRGKSTSCSNRRRRRPSRWKQWGESGWWIRRGVFKKRNNSSRLSATKEDACFEMSTTIWKLILVSTFFYFYFFLFFFFLNEPFSIHHKLFFRLQAPNTARTLSFLH